MAASVWGVKEVDWRGAVSTIRGSDLSPGNARSGGRLGPHKFSPEGQGPDNKNDLVAHQFNIANGAC